MTEFKRLLWLVLWLIICLICGSAIVFGLATVWPWVCWGIAGFIILILAMEDKMTIDEAIRRLEKEASGKTKFLDYADYQAAKLGIEALKRIKDFRISDDPHVGAPLPGETEE